MKIKIDAHKSPSSRLNASEPKSMHPRIVGSRTIDTRQIATEIQKMCTVTHVDIEAVLSALAQSLRQNLVEGQSVRLGGIGTFTLVPTFNRKVMEGERYTGADVGVKQIHFAPDHTLLQSIKHEAQFEKTRSTHSRSLLLGEAYLLIESYLQEHDTIDVDTAAILFSVKRDKAYRLLTELVERNKITRQKVHGTNFYRLFGA